MKTRKTIFWCILVLVIFVVVEGAAWIAHRVLFAESFSFSQIQRLRAKALAASSVSMERDGPLPVYLLHPYYGYILNPSWVQEYRKQSRTEDAGQLLIEDPLNAHGFFGDISPIQSRDPKKLIVAVTGGSVATYVASWGSEIFMEELQKLPPFRGKEVVMLNFGSAAYKQPQQAIIMTDILGQGGHIDLLINVDGFNEIALPRGHDAFGQGINPFFPQNWRLSTETHLSRALLRYAGRMALLQDRRVAWANWSKGAPWHYMIAPSTLWRIMDNRIVAQQYVLEQAMGKEGTSGMSGPVPTTADMRTSLGPAHGLANARELYEATARLWLNDSVFLNNLAASLDAFYVHVLQPNQYFPRSKPFTDDEAAIAFNNGSNYKPEVERGYPYLRSAGKALVALGVHFYDLSLLFESESAPVYRDACCHFTRSGNEKLVRAIIASVADAVAKDRSPYFIRNDATPDFHLGTLKSFTLAPETYTDGREVEFQ